MIAGWGWPIAGRGVVAESAFAVEVVQFYGRIAVCFGADAARAFGAVGKDFVGLEDFAGCGDFFAVCGEDDAMDGVLVVGLDERASLEIGDAGAIGAGEGVGGFAVNASFERGQGDEVEVELDGGAILGEDEGDGDGAVAFGADGEFFLLAVVVAQEGSVDGR